VHRLFAAGKRTGVAEEIRVPDKDGGNISLSEKDGGSA